MTRIIKASIMARILRAIMLLVYMLPMSNLWAAAPPEDNNQQDTIIDYTTSPNYGKSIAIFGGSFSRIEASNICKEYWKQNLDITWVDYGINGAGFSNLAQDPSIQYETDQCRAQNTIYDIYLLWCSSNDFVKVGDNIGSATDYTEADGFDPAKLDTQFGGMNYCYKCILEMNPDAQILLFTSLPVFSMGASGYETNYTYGIGLQQYVDAQIEWAQSHNVHYLDLFRLSRFNCSNYLQFYQHDALHLNDEGYEHLNEITSLFIAFPDREDIYQGYKYDQSGNRPKRQLYDIIGRKIEKPQTNQLFIK